MAAPTLVLLAAGMGSRFGGPKQIAPIGPGGSALIDYAARDATAAGFGRLVLIVRGEIAEAVERHVAGHWPPGLRPEYVRQDLEPAAVAAVAAGRSKPLGTAHALLAAAPVVGDGPFGVANADDLYGPAAYARLAAHLAGGGGHALVGYRLAATLLGDRPVNRALCQVDSATGRLTGVVEGAVHVGDGGSGPGRRLTWRPVGAPESEARPMTGDEPVSMNLWGFTPEIVPVLRAAFTAFEAGGGIPAGQELFLPNVVGEGLGAPPGEGLDVTLLVSEGRCLGVTHPDDVPLLQATLPGPAW
ncbi:MAG TPA: NTP transferase domain-containing protein [Acidimicrobiia bacterium]|nr:NTP transferase domain-containing protein [Acidimicrobiia bacterium]